MVIHKGKYDFYYKDTVDDDFCLIIFDHESQKIIDCAMVNVRVVNTITNDVTFEISDIVGKTESIIKESGNILVEINAYRNNLIPIPDAVVVESLDTKETKE